MFCSCRSCFPNYVQRVHSLIPRVHLFYLLCHFKSSLIKSQKCRLQRSVEESFVTNPTCVPKREWDSSVCNSLVSRELFSLMVGSFLSNKTAEWPMYAILHIYANDSIVSPRVPLKLSWQVISSRGSSGCERCCDHSTGKEKQNPCQVPGPGQTKSGARCSIGLEYTRLYRAEEERLLRSARAVTVRMGREHAPCSTEAVEKLEQNTQQSLSWGVSRVSAGVAQQMTSCRHVLLTRVKPGPGQTLVNNFHVRRWV